MTNKVIVFGDSFMYGTESFQHNFCKSKFLQDAGDAIGRWELVLDKDGVPDPPLTSQERNDYNDFMTKLEKHEDATHPHYYSIGGILSRKLDAKHINYAIGGHSNNIILNDVIKNLKTIDKETIVVCGISQPERRSYYGIHTSNGRTGTFTNCWSPVLNKDGYTKWKQLDLIFGDDGTARAIATLSYVKTIKQMINEQGCKKILFIDPFHQFCPNKYHPNIPWDYIEMELATQELFDNENLVEKYKHKDLVKFLKEQFSDLLLTGISEVFEQVEAEGNPIQCVGGHYSKYTYEKYVEQVILPELNK